MMSKASNRKALVSGLERSRKELRVLESNGGSPSTRRSMENIRGLGDVVTSQDLFFSDIYIRELAMRAAVSMLQGENGTAHAIIRQALRSYHRSMVALSLASDGQMFTAGEIGLFWATSVGIGDTEFADKIVKHARSALNEHRVEHAVARYNAYDPIGCVCWAALVEQCRAVGLLDSSQDPGLGSVTTPWARSIISSLARRDLSAIEPHLCSWIDARASDLTSSNRATWMHQPLYRIAPFELLGFCSWAGIAEETLRRCKSEYMSDVFERMVRDVEPFPDDGLIAIERACDRIEESLSREMGLS